MLIILMKIKGLNWILENYEFVNVCIYESDLKSYFKYFYFWFVKIYYILDKLIFLYLMI